LWVSTGGVLAPPASSPVLVVPRRVRRRCGAAIAGRVTCSRSCPCRRGSRGDSPGTPPLPVMYLGRQGWFRITDLSRWRYTLRSFSLSHSRYASPPTVAPSPLIHPVLVQRRLQTSWWRHRIRRRANLDLEALLREGVRCLADPFPVRRGPILPWAYDSTDFVSRGASSSQCRSRVRRPANLHPVRPSRAALSLTPVRPHRSVHSTDTSLFKSTVLRLAAEAVSRRSWP